MGKFKDFYQKIQEEKLLKVKGNVCQKDLTEPKSLKKTANGLLKKEDEQVSTEVLKADSKGGNGDGFFQEKEKRGEIPVVAKPVFGKVQKRRDLSTTQQDNVDETVNHTTPIPNQYPTGLINFGNGRKINSPDIQKIGGGFGYDVTISPSNGLFTFITDHPITFQMNPKGIMRFENTLDEAAIRKLIKNEVGSKDKTLISKLFRMIQYIRSLTKDYQNVCREYLRNFTDYNLFWKFDDQISKLNRDDEDYEQRLENIRRNIEGIKNKPNEENIDDFVNSQEFYNTLKKMGGEFGDYSLSDANRLTAIFSEMEKPRVTYFYPTLIDVIRMYDEGETSVRELPTDIVDIIDKNDEHMIDLQNAEQGLSINETLYTDVAASFHHGRPFVVARPKRYDLFTNTFGKDLGDIVYEFVSENSGNWNRLTDKGVLIGYNSSGKFSSVDIFTCYLPAYCDIARLLRGATNFNKKYHDGGSIPVSLLKTCLQNVFNKHNGESYVALDHDDDKERVIVKKAGTRRFL